MFKVEMNYPDSHVEELELSFETKEEAVKYGRNLLVQVANTESYHKPVEDGFLGRKKIKPYFIVLDYAKKKAVVFDSRKK